MNFGNFSSFSGLLGDATTDTDDPVPGYMLIEISKMTLSSYPACEELENYLINRIQKNSHNIKFKCLCIIKHVCRTGRLEFKKDMSRRVEQIKACLSFRGPPDPLRGDVIYKRVRDLAKETLDAIFDSQMPVVTSAVAAHGRIQGIGGGQAPPAPQGQGGSRQGQDMTGKFYNAAMETFKNTFGDSQEGGGSYGSMGPGSGYVGGGQVPGRPGMAQSGHMSSSSNSSLYSNGGSNDNNYGQQGYPSNNSNGNQGMSGFGNPNFADPRLEKTWTERALGAMEGAMNSAGKSMGFDPNVNTTGVSNYNFASNRGPNAPNNVYSQGSHGGSGGGGTPGLPGGGGKPWPENMQPRIEGNTLSAETGVVGRAGNAQSDGTYEEGLIDALCSPSGLKAVVPADQLDKFIVDAATLDSDMIGYCLQDKVTSSAWQSRVKALLVINALCGAPGCGLHRQWWSDNSNNEEVYNRLEDTKTVVRKEAKAVLVQLGLATSSNGNNKKRGKGESKDLLGDTDGGDLLSEAPPGGGSTLGSELASVFDVSTTTTSNSNNGSHGNGSLDLLDMDPGSAPALGLLDASSTGSLTDMLAGTTTSNGNGDGNDGGGNNGSNGSNGNSGSDGSNGNSGSDGSNGKDGKGLTVSPVAVESNTSAFSFMSDTTVTATATSNGNGNGTSNGNGKRTSNGDLDLLDMVIPSISTGTGTGMYTNGSLDLLGPAMQPIGTLSEEARAVEQYHTMKALIGGKLEAEMNKKMASMATMGGQAQGAMGNMQGAMGGMQQQQQQGFPAMMTPQMGGNQGAMGGQMGMSQQQQGVPGMVTQGGIAPMNMQGAMGNMQQMGMPGIGILPPQGAMGGQMGGNIPSQMGMPGMSPQDALTGLPLGPSNPQNTMVRSYVNNAVQAKVKEKKELKIDLDNLKL